MFRHRALIPGPGVGVDAWAAALNGAGHGTAGRLLESFADHNLLTGQPAA
jgi:hypothetical protein